MVRCSRCEKRKPSDQFYENLRNNNGLDCYCRQCRIEKSKLWVKENRQRVNEKRRRMYANNPRYRAKALKAAHEYQESLRQQRRNKV